MSSLTCNIDIFKEKFIANIVRKHLLKSGASYVSERLIKTSFCFS